MVCSEETLRKEPLKRTRRTIVLNRRKEQSGSSFETNSVSWGSFLSVSSETNHSSFEQEEVFLRKRMSGSSETAPLF